MSMEKAFSIYTMVRGEVEAVERFADYDTACNRLNELVEEFNSCGDVVEAYELFLLDHGKVVAYRSAWD